MKAITKEARKWVKKEIETFGFFLARDYCQENYDSDSEWDRVCEKEFNYWYNKLDIFNDPLEGKKC